MDERLASILRAISPADMAKVAAGALRAPNVTLVGAPVLEALATTHFDQRTIGIVRASGTATGVSNAPLTWSAVAKISDFAIVGRADNTTQTEGETLVYERRLFTDDGLKFRPARCYGILRPLPSVRVLWLEDLTHAKGTPFDVPTLSILLRHLGEWNGYHAQRHAKLDTPSDRDNCIRRWGVSDFSGAFNDLPIYAASPAWRRAFGGLSSDIVLQLHDVLRALVASTAALPHGLAFGDVAAGNVFLSGEETVAIDWASLTIDPIGVDGGCLAGGPLTWAGGSIIGEAEPQLYESYLDGLRAGGWTGRRDEVRRAYLSHYGLYMLYCGLMPSYTGHLDAPFSREFIEGRWKTTLDKVPDGVAGTIQRIPAMIEEVSGLLG